MSVVKRCTKCGQDKPTTAFSKCSRVKSGLCAQCKACMYATSSAWVKKNRARANELAANYRKSNRAQYLQTRREWQKENRDKLRAQDRQRYADNPEQHKASSRKYRQKHREVVLARTRRWKKTNPDKVSAYSAWYSAKYSKELRRKRLAKYQHTIEKSRLNGRNAAAKRKARKLAAFVEDVNPLVVFNQSGGVCGICRRRVGERDQWHIDHVIPLSKGGEHSYRNTQLAHAYCNLSKHNRVAASA